MRPPLVGNIADQSVHTGCGCHWQLPSERRANTNRHFFKADLGERAWMNIGGRDVELRLVGATHMSLKDRKGQRMDFRFAGPGGIRVRVRMLVTRTSTYEQDYEPGRYTVVVEAAKGGRRQVVTLRNETCGC